MANKQAQELAKLLQLEGIKSEDVLQAIADTPRHQFLPDDLRGLAYVDDALPIGSGQTISQPFIVARMSELVYQPQQSNRVLEIGTGSGYQAAILSKLFGRVYTIERIQALYESAANLFTALGYDNIFTRYADGFFGWPEAGPYDAIMVTAAALEAPQALLDQLSDGGKMITPLGERLGVQSLYLFHRTGDEFTSQQLDPVTFVPMLKGIE